MQCKGTLVTVKRRFWLDDTVGVDIQGNDRVPGDDSGGWAGSGAPALGTLVLASDRRDLLYGNLAGRSLTLDHGADLSSVPGTGNRRDKILHAMIGGFIQLTVHPGNVRVMSIPLS